MENEGKMQTAEYRPFNVYITSLHPEADHLEAYKFSLYVGNNAGDFQPTNQNHGIFFA